MREPCAAAIEEKLRVRARLSVSPDLREIAPAVDEAVRVATAPHHPSLCPGVDELRLALTEALNNVVEHADHPSHEPIKLCIADEDDLLQICIQDAGKPLPVDLLEEPALPTEPVIDEPLVLDELQEGGWGWMLIRASTTGLHYSRQAGKNRLCLGFDSATLTPPAGRVVAFAADLGEG
ncbi:MAG: ATP-binding protein [Pseudomonadota bacterium]